MIKMGPYYLVLLLSAVSSAVARNMRVPASEVQTRSDGHSNYTMVDIEWRGFKEFDNDTVFKGTIQDVIKQMKQIKGHDFEPDFVVRAHSAVKTPNRAAQDDPPSNNQRVVCGVGGAGEVLKIILEDGIGYLAELDDSVMCSNGPGPQNCGRISCSWNVAIWDCNERTEPGPVVKCNVFAKYAQNILDHCTTPTQASHWTGPHVRGQDFDDDFGISTIAGRDHC
ncbi:hypothetical protein HD806DRAFT_508700 [Xylariaceae sp. AK1471]|nr:hypothetical protein HD806DRAFT_508700 [Xylariaceae sp. AK1471]